MSVLFHKWRCTMSCLIPMKVKLWWHFLLIFPLQAKLWVFSVEGNVTERRCRWTLSSPANPTGCQQIPKSLSSRCGSYIYPHYSPLTTTLHQPQIWVKAKFEREKNQPQIWVKAKFEREKISPKFESKPNSREKKSALASPLHSHVMQRCQ